MIIPVRYCIKVFGTDSFELSLTWKDEDGNIFDLSSWAATMTFFKSRTDRTIVKTIDSTPVLDTDSRIDLSNVSPNIYVFIQGDETFIDPNPSVPTGGFLYEPGYYTLDLGPQDTQDTVDRLIKGGVQYEP